MLHINTFVLQISHTLLCKKLNFTVIITYHHISIRSQLNECIYTRLTNSHSEFLTLKVGYNFSCPMLFVCAYCQELIKTQCKFACDSDEETLTII